MSFPAKRIIMSSLLRRLLIISIIALYAIPVRAVLAADSVATAMNDTLPEKSEYRFKPTQLILPASLIAVGTFGAYNPAFKQFDRWIKGGMDDLRGEHYFHADDYIQYLPLVAYFGLDFAGVKARHSFKERFAAGATAYAAMAIMVSVTKPTVKEPRPDNGARNSFPSGHAARVFTGAELVRMEYGTGIAIGAYTVATGVAFLRLYNGRHWFNDVLAGAGIGILSARIGYWMLPVYQRWFGWNKPTGKSSVALVPGYDTATRTLSVNFACCF